MQKALLYKIAMIIGVMFFLGIALIMVQATVRERTAFHDEAVRSIAADSVGEQTIIGPILVVPYTDDFEEQVAAGADSAKATEARKRSVARHLLVYPDELQINGAVETDRRYRGIHKVLVYSGQHAFSGAFAVPTQEALPRANGSSRISLGKPYLALSISDVRGIRNIPKLTWGGASAEFEQGSGLEAYRSGLHATLAPMAMNAPTRVAFAFDLGLDGIEGLHIAPVGKNNRVTLKSNWPHPQFGGSFLPSPKGRTINAAGFSATWDISSLATSAQQQLTHLEQSEPAADKKQPPAGVDQFTVNFIEPVNAYSLADRATKYGLLFVALTFAAFFVFEIVRQLPIHPIQYALVGLALVLFFLLLLGLSEHINFLVAYVLASLGCIVLIGYYLSFVLHSWRRGYGFGAALTMLYGALYGLLISENNALVLGSLLLFAVLAAAMTATRKVDWYQVGKESAPQRRAGPEGNSV